MIETLRQKWPALFAVNDQPIVVGSAIQIQQALSIPPESMRELHKALGKHCASTAYRRAVAAGKQRMSIEGAMFDVLPAHQEAAVKMLEAQQAAKRRKRAKRAAAPAAVAPAPKVAPVPPVAVERAPVIVVKKRRVLEKS